MLYCQNEHAIVHFISRKAQVPTYNSFRITQQGKQEKQGKSSYLLGVTKSKWQVSQASIYPISISMISPYRSTSKIIKKCFKNNPIYKYCHVKKSIAQELKRQPPFQLWFLALAHYRTSGRIDGSDVVARVYKTLEKTERVFQWRKTAVLCGHGAQK